MERILPEVVMNIEYARGRTPRDYSSIQIYDGMGYIDEGEYSLQTLGERGWMVVNVNGWSFSVANILLMRYAIRP